MKAKCRTRVESELGRPLDEAEVTLIDQSIVRQLRQASSENRAAFKAMSPAQRIRQAGARAAEDLRGYRYKGDAWSNQDKEDLRVRIEREAVKAGGKIEDVPPEARAIAEELTGWPYEQCWGNNALGHRG